MTSTATVCPIFVWFFIFACFADLVKPRISLEILESLELFVSLFFLDEPNKSIKTCWSLFYLFITKICFYRFAENFLYIFTFFHAVLFLTLRTFFLNMYILVENLIFLKICIFLFISSKRSIVFSKKLKMCWYVTH